MSAADDHGIAALSWCCEQAIGAQRVLSWFSVVQGAAVAGRVAPDRLLRQVMGLPDAVMDDAVRAAVAEGLLTPDDDGYSFAHDLLRSAVYDDLLPGERAAHAAHAAVLEGGRRPGPSC